jgi:hypothetical protein
MTRESLFYKILSAVHIVFFTSILFFLTVLLSLGFLLLPALGAIFLIGKDVIYKEINITDSIVKTYFVNLKHSLHLMKYIPVHLIMLLNLAGIYLWAGADKMIYSVLCLAMASILLVFMLYIAGYRTFIGKNIDLIEITCIIFIKLPYFILLFVGVVCLLYFFSDIIMFILIPTSTFFIFVLEAVIFIQILLYRKTLGTLSEEDEFYYLTESPFRRK